VKPALAILLLNIACLPAVFAAEPSRPRALAADPVVRALQDREAIRVLLRDYGRTLDARDFDGFAALFAANAQYVSGTTVTGPAAIGQSLKDIMGRNPLGFREPNFHVFFNEVIDVHGDRATSTSQSLFVVPGERNTPELALMASYEDVLVREGGRWKFLKRIVHGDIPVPRPKI
jgi:hypothetical protein